MPNRNMNIEQILVVWNDQSKTNETVTAELQFPNFQTLKNKVTRCSQKELFIKRPANFTPVVNGAADPAPVAEEVVLLAETEIKVGLLFNCIIENEIVEKRLLIQGPAGSDFKPTMINIVNKYSLGQGRWLNTANNQEVGSEINADTVYKFFPSVHAG